MWTLLKVHHACRVSYLWEWLEIWRGDRLIIVAVPFGSWKTSGSAAIYQIIIQKSIGCNSKMSLGVTDPKNVFRSFLTYPKMLLYNFKTFYLVDFFNSLTHSFIYLLMSSDKYNSIITKAMDLIFALFDVTLSQDVPLANHSSSSASIMVQLKFTFVLHCFLHCHLGDDLW